MFGQSSNVYKLKKDQQKHLPCSDPGVSITSYPYFRVLWVLVFTAPGKTLYVKNICYLSKTYKYLIS